MADDARDFGGYWIMSWTVDRYHAGSRLRFPRMTMRNTGDERAARRFCKRWGLTFPEKETP